MQKCKNDPDHIALIQLGHGCVVAYPVRGGNQMNSFAWCLPCAAEPGHQTLTIKVQPDDGEIAGLRWELATAIQHHHTGINANVAPIPFMSEKCKPSSWWNFIITLLDLLNLQQIIGYDYDCQSNNPEKKNRSLQNRNRTTSSKMPELQAGLGLWYFPSTPKRTTSKGRTIMAPNLDDAFRQSVADVTALSQNRQLGSSARGNWPSNFQWENPCTAYWF